MKHPHLPFALLLAALLSGCSTDQFARVLYYSFRVRNPAVESSPRGRHAAIPCPSITISASGAANPGTDRQSARRP